MSEYNPFFSKIYDLVFFPFLHPLRKNVTKQVAVSNPQKVIDMCCGTGNQIKYLRKLKIQNIIGIDISDNMLAVAQKNKLEKYCQKQDATNTSFENECFDIAVLNFILHETKPEIAEKITAEAKRIVKKSGKIIITDYVIDKKTNFMGKAGAFFVEFLIGGQHYSNFKTYIKNNLLKQYTSDLKIISEQKFLFGAVRIHTFINH
jgi:demethylmenaquinone methyltransferase/2-methoxy-6-polyprenyl-1,4-benzoquinol methylase